MRTPVPRTTRPRPRATVATARSSRRRAPPRWRCAPASASSTSRCRRRTRPTRRRAAPTTTGASSSTRASRSGRSCGSQFLPQNAGDRPPRDLLPGRAATSRRRSAWTPRPPATAGPASAAPASGEDRRPRCAQRRRVDHVVGAGRWREVRGRRAPASSSSRRHPGHHAGPLQPAGRGARGPERSRLRVSAPGPASAAARRVLLAAPVEMAARRATGDALRPRGGLVDWWSRFGRSPG